MKKLIQASLLFYLCFSFSNANAAFNLDWVSTTADPTFSEASSVSLNDFDTVLTSNITLNGPNTTYFDFTWEFKDGSSPANIPGTSTTLSFNAIGNFTITSILFNGVQVGPGTIGSFSGAMITGTNTIRMIGNVISVGNDLDVRIAATPIPAAVWLFGSALLGIGALSSRRKSLTAKSLVA